jgi:hypothetical protein
MPLRNAAALVDTLVDHLGVFDRSLSWPPRGSATPARSAEGDALRRWLRKLSPEARREALTVHDAPFCALLLGMQAQLAREGPGVFFVDVDMPPVLRGPDADLPAVCFRRARGLPARLPAQQAAQRWLASALRVAPPALRLADEACDDVDALLAAADELSWGAFLSRPPAWRADGAAHASRAGLALGSGPGAAERWVETPWLGTLGYYTLEAWVLNRLETAIWARLRAASRAAPPRAPSAATPAARWAALAPAVRIQREREHGNAACAARTVAAALRPAGAAARDWHAARAALEALIAAVDAVFVPWREASDHDQAVGRLLWQPLALAATPAGVLCGRVGAACVAAAEGRAAAAAAGALLQDEEAERRAEEEARCRKAEKRARARDSARSRRAQDEAAAAAAAAAAVVQAAISRVVAAAAAPATLPAQPVAPPPRPPAAVMQRRQSAGSGKRARRLGWMPGVGLEGGPPPPPPGEDSPESAHRDGAMARVFSSPMFAAGQATSAPNSPGRSARASPRLASPPPRPRPPRAPLQPQPHPDYGEIFGISSGSFWSSADLAAWPPGSRASSVSSEDSTITNSSVGGWREAVVGTLFAEQQQHGAAAMMGFYAPDENSGNNAPGRLSRSMSGSPDDRAGGVGWARIAAMRPSSARSDARPTRGSSLSPARPSSPLVMFPPPAPPGAAVAGPARPRLGSHDDARAAAAAPLPAGPAAAPLSLAPGATPRLSAELLRRVAAPASATGAASLYAEAAAARRRFWADGGAPLEAAAARLGVQLEAFAAAVGEAALQARPARLEAVTRVTRALQDLWPRARTRVFGSEATGLALPSSDVDLVVALPPVRQALRPIMEAGILEGRNAIQESLVKQAARQLARQDWAAAESMLSVENTAVPIVSLAVRCGPHHAADQPVRVDLSFDAPGHAGLTSAELVRELLARYPALAPLALALKQFLKERSLHHAYTGGLSSYCLLLLLAAYSKHAAALDGPLPLGRLFADVLAFYGRAFDPRRSAVALAAPAPAAGVTAAPPPVAALFPPRGGREALIDVLHISDPLQLSQGQDVNVARNCFRMLQIQKALGDASKLIDAQLLGGDAAAPLLESLISTRV